MLTTISRDILKPHEVSFFKENGYIIKRQALDPDLMQKDIDLTWQKLPDSFERTNPETWKGIVTDCMKTQSLTLRRGLVRLRKCLYSNELLMDLLPDNPIVWGVLEQLLGEGQVEKMPRCHRRRGVNCIFPLPESKYMLGPKDLSVLINALRLPHYDEGPKQIVTIGYLDDVLPGGGGLYLWPKSHRLMYRAFNSRSGKYPNLLLPLVRSIYKLRRPVELHGGAGDVIFFHHRLLHRISINCTQRIRYATVWDFWSKDFERTLDKSKPLPMRDSTPCGKNMWEGWNI